MYILEQTQRHLVELTDILGDEDHLGDMDFKVAGTANGINALQMDIKIDGITSDIMETALDQAKNARMHILNEMNKDKIIKDARTAKKNMDLKIQLMDGEIEVYRKETKKT